VQRPEVAVVRHPIADGRNNVVGFELRFGGAVDLGDPSRDAKATSALLVEAFGDIGLERLAGRHPAWVSIARNFQGDYFAKPRLFRHRGVATAGLGSLRRLSELTAGDVSFEDLERIISSDVGLSLKLLRYVNSAFFALPRTVSSVREELLAEVTAYERGEFPTAQPADAGVSLAGAYRAALEWADEAGRAIA
jgi:c-di-GMP-related signal transduction protein